MPNTITAESATENGKTGATSITQSVWVSNLIGESRVTCLKGSSYANFRH
jgi:hypothetical protein